MNNLLSTGKIKAAVSSAAGLLLVITSYVPVKAAPPPVIDLVLGGEGATAWSFTNIKPGDSGTRTVTLRNAGTSDGLIKIWVGNLTNLRIAGVDPKYAGLAGELADYLRLNASSRGLEANVALPAIVKNFPQTSSGLYYVRINPLRSGETINLTWRWELPAQTGNNVQGKGTSFILYYMLAELPPPAEPPVEEAPAVPAVPAPATPQIPPAEPQTPPVTPSPLPPAPEPAPPVRPVPQVPPAPPVPEIPPPPPLPEIPTPAPTATLYKSLGVNMVNAEFMLKTDASGIVQEDYRLSDKVGNFVIDIAKGTRITDQDGKALDRFELTVIAENIQDLVAIPSGVVPIGPVYAISGYRDGKQVSRIYFEPYVTLTLAYEPKLLPDNALPPFVVNFVKGGNLVRLGSPPGSIFESGKVKATAYHTSYFALMAEVVSPPAPLPPHFKVTDLKVNPLQARPGQTVTISVNIANDGAAGGTYELHLIIDGVVRAVKEVNLEPYSIARLTFEVADLAPGRHLINVAGLTGEFRVIDAVAIVPGTPIDWSSVDMAVVGLLLSGLLATILIVTRLHRADRSSK